MRIWKIAGMSVMFVLVSLPFIAVAEDYISPSVMRIDQKSDVKDLLNYSNYSYADKPFDKVLSHIDVGYFLSAENAAYQIVINITNQRDQHVSVKPVPYFCKIGSNDCRRLSCNYYSNQLDLPPRSSKSIFCSIIVSECAGSEMLLEYTVPEIKGSVVTKNIIRCPQKFCDQVEGSMSVPKLSYAGDEITAEGYFSVIGGDGIASPVAVHAGKYNVNTSSNDFGYWNAPVEIDEPGFYDISAISGSCGREAKSSIQILGIENKPSNYTLYAYPKNLDMEMGGSALLAVQNNGAGEIELSLSGVPSDWIEPSEFSMGHGIKFVYVSPKYAGNYLIKIRSGSEEREVNLFVADKFRIEKIEENESRGFIVLLAAALFLVMFKRTGGAKDKKRGYLDEVKREIENSARLF